MYLSRTLLLILAHIVLHIDHVSTTETFIVSFQSSAIGSLSPSTDEWIEYLTTVPPSKEFTACNWMRVKYFSRDIAIVLWSYCTKERFDSPMNCLQIFLKNKRNTGNRHLEANGWFPWSRHTFTMARADIKPYMHRTWFHFCWSYSSLSGKSKMYYNGNLIKEEYLQFEGNITVIGKSEQVSEEAFIFGQEPDIIKGDYDPLETFIGDLAELNVWSYIVRDDMISGFAKCHEAGKGDVIAWKMANFKINKAIVKEGHHLRSFCDTIQQYIIFPQKKLFVEARKICEIHGGKIVMPKSENEHNITMNLVENYKHECIGSTEYTAEKMLWLGGIKRDGKWHEIESNGSVGNIISYARWGMNDSFRDKDCSYILSNGLWNEGKHVTCGMEKLCSVCHVMNTPVFTLKGLCSTTTMDWNYYLNLDESNKVLFYEGYKLTKIIFGQGKWKILMKGDTDQSFKAELSGISSTDFPLGRHEWFVNDLNCGLMEKKRNLTISMCDFGREFTCHSGTCINMGKRCDEKEDCYDGSDEEDCKLVLIPKQYQKRHPSAFLPNDEGKELHIHIRTVVVSIDLIDTVNMVVGLTIKIHMKWFDKRLSFFSPLTNKSNVVPEETVKNLWLPTNHLFHENAIIGEINQGETKKLSFESKIAEPMDVSKTEENLLFSGSNNLLQITQRFNIKYNCVFNVKAFPFDKGLCNFTMMIKGNRHIDIRFLEAGPIIYDGPSYVHQFGIGEMNTIVEDINEKTTYTFTMSMNRIFTNQLLTTFIPTFILWLLAYSTLFINVEHSSDRLMVAVTTLLVLAALLNTFNQDLPKTSYIKFVDIWFTWHIASIFGLIVYHIALDSKTILNKQEGKATVHPNDATDDKRNATKAKKMSKETLNKAAILLAPVVNGIFYFVLFYHFIFYHPT